MRGYVIKLIGLIFVSFLVLSPVSLARRVNVPQISQNEIFDEINNLIKQAEDALAIEDSALALTYLDAVTSSSSSLDDPLEKASILARVSSLYQKIDSDAKAGRCIEETKELLAQCKGIALNIKDDITRALCFARIARCYSLIGDLAGQNSSMGQVSTIMHNMSNDDIANIDIDRFRDLASLMVSSYQEHDSFIFKGSFLQEFLTEMDQVRVYFKNHGGGIKLARCEEMVAFLYDRLGSYNQAIKFYKLAAHRYENIDTYISAELSFRAAELCLKIYNSGGENNIDERDGAAKSFALASHSYESTKEWEKASESAERAFEINRDRGSYNLASRSILWAAVNMRRYAKDTGKAEDYMKEASLWVMRGDILREYGQEIVEIDAREAMINSYEEATAAYEEAYSIYRENSNLEGMRETIVARERAAGYLESVLLN